MQDATVAMELLVFASHLLRVVDGRVNIAVWRLGGQIETLIVFAVSRIPNSPYKI
jgi:hypothetical protein